MLGSEELDRKYPTLSAFSFEVLVPPRKVVGRDAEINKLMATLMRPELSNALLLAPPGSGKTTLVQEARRRDTIRKYLEIDLARMIADLNNVDEMAAKLKTLFDEAERYAASEHQELVLFMDEFHQIVQLSDAAVEALKPVLGASGTRGLRVIAATTNEEFHKHISSNQPLVERLQRINIPEPDRDTTVKILRGMAERYEVEHLFYDDTLFELIYEYTNRYNSQGSQPRKSIAQLDGMVGWHRFQHRRMDRSLLADVIKDSTGINVIHNTDPNTVEAYLNDAVLSQQMATRLIADRMQIVVADLYDKSRPVSSILFTGSSGVGKTELAKAFTRLLFGDADKHFIRFDMSEYSQPDSLRSFQSLLTRAVWNMGHSVILFDEIEKAHSAVSRLLLQVLDDGRLSDDHGRQVSFLNTHIIMTTNAGSEIYKTIAQYNVDDSGSGLQMADYMKNIRRSLMGEAGATSTFPPELLGRIDTFVPFQPLSLETQRKIVEKKLFGIVTELRRKYGITCSVGTRVLNFLVDEHVDTDSNAGGARTAVGLMNSTVVTEVSRFVNLFPSEKVIHIDIEGQLASSDKSLRKGTAQIVVSAVR